MLGTLGTSQVWTYVARLLTRLEQPKASTIPRERERERERESQTLVPDRLEGQSQPQPGAQQNIDLSHPAAATKPARPG